MFIVGDMVKEIVDIFLSFCIVVIVLYSFIYFFQEEQVEMIQCIVGWFEKDGCFFVVFGKDEVKGMVMEKWLYEKGWVYFSGLGVEGMVKIVEEVGLKVEVKVVEEGLEEIFLWVIVRK